MDKYDYVNGCYPTTEKEWDRLAREYARNTAPVYTLEVTTNSGIKPNPCEIIKVDFRRKKVINRFIML